LFVAIAPDAVQAKLNQLTWSGEIDPLADDLSEIVFIIDNISTAYAVAIMAKGKEIHCIYECKEITWRKADFVALFDFILSDVKFLSKRVISVPHPYLKPSRTVLGRIISQLNFAAKVRKLVSLDTSRIYASSMVSSLLIAYKRRLKRKPILIDEGMGSLIARNRIIFRDGAWIAKLKVVVGDFLLAFQFGIDTPQISLANDGHKSVVRVLDYRDFDSSAFASSLARLERITSLNSLNVLVLLKGPSATADGHPDEKVQLGSAYVEYNLTAILSYKERLPKHEVPTFFLKSHPMLGNSAGKLSGLIAALEQRGLSAHDVLSYVDFPEASSLPAEGLLRYLNFRHVLSLDVSSLLWNVAYRGAVECFMPISEIIKFSEFEGGTHTPLYLLQRRINDLTGGAVQFFEVEKKVR